MIDGKNLKKGMKVYIVRNCTNTIDTQGWNQVMETFTGTIQPITAVIPNAYKPHVRIQGWCWDCRDLRKTMPRKKVEKTIFFDEQRLWS